MSKSLLWNIPQLFLGLLKTWTTLETSIYNWVWQLNWTANKFSKLKNQQESPDLSSSFPLIKSSSLRQWMKENLLFLIKLYQNTLNSLLSILKVSLPASTAYSLCKWRILYQCTYCLCRMPLKLVNQLSMYSTWREVSLTGRLKLLISDLEVHSRMSTAWTSKMKSFS